MKLSDYRSRGREPFVFRADGPEGLIGAHAALISSALQPDEEIRYLLYSPIRQGDTAPFDIQARPCSHAVAVTGGRFLISKDLHDEVTPPSIQSIAFNRVLCVEIGSALLLGWFVVTFENEGNPSKLSLFYTSTGSHHFEAAVREYRLMSTASVRENAWEEDTLSWSTVWRLTPRSQIDLLKSLIAADEDERPLDILRFKERWTEGRKRKKVCVTTDGIFLMTDWGNCIHVAEERPIGPGVLAYGVNARCFPADIIRSTTIIRGTQGNRGSEFLHLELERGFAVVQEDLPLDQETLASAERWLEHVRQRIER